MIALIKTTLEFAELYRKTQNKIITENQEKTDERIIRILQSDPIMKTRMSNHDRSAIIRELNQIKEFYDLKSVIKKIHISEKILFDLFQCNFAMTLVMNYFVAHCYSDGANMDSNLIPQVTSNEYL